jgi:hypothetical protein
MKVIVIFNSDSDFCKRVIQESPIPELFLLPINKTEIYERVRKSAYDIKEIPTVLVLDEKKVDKYEGLFAYKFLFDMKERLSNKKLTYVPPAEERSDSIREATGRAPPSMPVRRSVMADLTNLPSREEAETEVQIESKSATELKKLDLANTYERMMREREEDVSDNSAGGNLMRSAVHPSTGSKILSEDNGEADSGTEFHIDRNMRSKLIGGGR